MLLPYEDRRHHAILLQRVEELVELGRGVKERQREREPVVLVPAPHFSRHVYMSCSSVTHPDFAVAVSVDEREDGLAGTDGRGRRPASLAQGPGQLLRASLPHRSRE